MNSVKWMITLLLGLVCLETSAQLDLTQTKKVIRLQESLLKNTQSYALWDGWIANTLKAFTLCYRVKIFYYRPEVTVFSFIDKNSFKIRTDHNRIGMQVLLTKHNFRVDTGIITPLMHWAAFCFGFDSNTSQFLLFFNGKKWDNTQNSGEENVEVIDDIERDPVETSGDGTFTPDGEVLMEVGGTVVLGQDQDAPLSEFDATQSFSGAVTDLNIWSRLLSEKELAEISGCQKRVPGDVIDWDASQWTIGPDASQVDVALNETCDINPAPYFMFPVKVQFSDAHGLCQAFGGEVATPNSAEEQEVVYQLATKSSDICAKDGSALMWLGITDQKEEGKWVLQSNESDVTYFNWGKGQPNGKAIENCAVMKGSTYKGQWADQQCRKSFKVCVMCSLTLPVFIRFRGICDATLYDDRFVMAGMKNSKPYFRGYYRSQLYYNEAGVWKLERIGINNTYATKKNDGSISFPIGRHLWIFSHGFCGKEQGMPQSLTFTQCAKNDEFTCDDGTCIPIREVCDRRVQCPDLSDETDCSTVLLPKGYQTTLPPPSDSMSDALPVYLNLTINSFEQIDAINNEFTAEIIVRMIWKDMRLQFKHLRKDRQLNIILPSEANTIWIPIVDFLNAEDNQHTMVDSECKITIKRLGPPLQDNIEYSREARIYEGSENYIRVVRKYTVTFKCNFNFFYFPFSTDYCSMDFRVNKNTKNYVTLEKYGPGVRYKRQDKLTEYEIGRIYMERMDSDEPYSGLRTVIEMKHLFVSEVVTIFIPTTLINLISFMTFFFKWFDFQNRIMVSLTALLVLTTLFAQIADNLPKTSYFKLIDIWFFGSIVFAFSTIMIHTAVEFNHHYGAPTESLPSSPSQSFPPKVVPVTEVESDKKLAFGRTKMKHPHSRAMSIHRMGKIVTLSVYFIFSLIFWIVAFLQKATQNGKEFPQDEEFATGYPD